MQCPIHTETMHLTAKILCKKFTYFRKKSTIFPLIFAAFLYFLPKNRTPAFIIATSTVTIDA